MTVRPLFAAAKVNLNLHVTGRRADGYHVLDSLVGFAGIGDTVSVEPADGLTLELSGPFATGLEAGPDNLILRAAALFETDLGARIRLEKNLPVASGLGGGSADAAAALRGLSDLWNLPLPGQDTLLSLGADVPVCMAEGPQRLRGIGNWLDPVHWMPDLPVVLVNPNVPVETPAIFARLERRSNGALPALPKRPLNLSETVDWLAGTRNDLQAPAIAEAPVIKDVLHGLASSTLLARMSGSGATCFGICETEAAARAVCEDLNSAYPNWWCVATTLCGRARSLH